MTFKKRREVGCRRNAHCRDCYRLSTVATSLSEARYSTTQSTKNPGFISNLSFNLSIGTDFI
jgi:hypothetical protein